ncbi:MAG TPA: hypothetical protein VF407_03375 [Polyangiaceae bacterium]
MARDSLFGETILWSGRPKVVASPPAYKLISVASGIVAATALAFAVVVSVGLGAHVGGLVVFSAWCTTIALAAWKLPIVWRDGLEFIVTDKHVIWRRGRIRRSIDRHAVSYAIIRWDPKVNDVGDLTLVRAVPTGALKRTLEVTLPGVVGPDRLWAIVRDATVPPPFCHGDLPLAQRLDPGERVLWSGTPTRTRWSVRRIGTLGIAALSLLALVRMGLKAVPSIEKVSALHALPLPLLSFLIMGVALGALLLVAVAGIAAYEAAVRPNRIQKATRYFVTDKRVLIRRGADELSLDRGRIADVIAAPLDPSTKVDAEGNVEKTKLHDVYLVLDGPQARAFASSGAFGGGQEHDALVPVFTSIEDAESVVALLRSLGDDVPPSLPKAA